MPAHRASLALGESSSLLTHGPAHNAAAEISKVSMGLAKSRAAALMDSLSEVEALEQQQLRLQRLREAQSEAQKASHSTKKPERGADGWQSVGETRLYALLDIHQAGKLWPFIPTHHSVFYG